VQTAFLLLRRFIDRLGLVNTARHHASGLRECVIGLQGRLAVAIRVALVAARVAAWPT